MHEYGFTLVEALVSMLVLSIVALASSALFAQSSRLGMQAAQAAAATGLAGELADLLRIVPLAGPPGAGGVLLDAELDKAAAPPDCFSTACTLGQLGTFEVNDWMRRAGLLLPSARVLVCRDSGGRDPKSGRYPWTCSGGSMDPLLVKLGWQSTLEAQGTATVRDPMIVVTVQ